MLSYTLPQPPPHELSLDGMHWQSCQFVCSPPPPPVSLIGVARISQKRGHDCCEVEKTGWSAGFPNQKKSKFGGGAQAEIPKGDGSRPPETLILATPPPPDSNNGLFSIICRYFDNYKNSRSMNTPYNTSQSYSCRVGNQNVRQKSCAEDERLRIRWHQQWTRTSIRQAETKTNHFFFAKNDPHGPKQGKSWQNRLSNVSRSRPRVYISAKNLFFSKKK